MSSIPFFARRWVAGTRREDAIAVARELNQKGIAVSLDLLGEDVTDPKVTVASRDEYIQLLRDMAAAKVDGHISIKLSMLGLVIDPELCWDNLAALLRLADELGMRVACDMEGTAITEATISMWERAAREFKSPEIVLQAYLHRTGKDIDRVLAANGRMRLCKGAYKEPVQVALQDRAGIVAQYKSHLAKLLDGAKHVCIATHDDELIDYAKSLIRDRKVPRERYEFQMLYGMRAKTWSAIAGEGHPMCVYVPYGESWQAYYSRRLMEKKTIGFVLRNLFRS